ncbi:MAG TPA: hypothetical protein VFC19_21590 [Candidatus Limnocylindrales bacterium]|nr:hypothetical protein [Candidatus Limnocylindrales bacterium]
MGIPERVRLGAAAAAATLAVVSGIVSGVGVATGLPLVAQAGVWAGASGSAPQPSASGGLELVYVANVNGPVTGYPAASVGAVWPVRSLADPHDPNTFWGPWGVAFDAARSAYVQSFLSSATTFVYPPGAAVPGRIFRVDGPDSRAIAIDAAGYAYVATGQAGAVISVAAPGASGVPANLYTVFPVRQIPTDETPFHPWPSILSTDNAGHVIAAVVRSQGNAIEVFTAGPSGPSWPVRTIAGPHTGLGSCAAVCDQLAVSYSPLTDQLYVAVSQGQQTRINVYPASANGDTVPVRVIGGPSTGLAGQVVTGIATSRIDGSVYALVKPAQFNSPGTVLVFDRFAGGNTAPRRRFTDAATGLRDTQGIAITS